MHEAREAARTAPASPVPSGRFARLPWWALIILAGGLFLFYLILADTDYRETFNFLKVGLAVTLRITLISFPIATFFGLVTGLARLSKSTLLQTLATLYVEVMRGIPLVVLLLTFSFGIIPVGVDLINRLSVWGLTWVTNESIIEFLTPLTNRQIIRSVPIEMRAILALAIAYGAFEAEIFRAGIQSIGKGQVEAARSLGMNYFQTMRYIILPQAIRRVLPPLGNDFIALLKDSSLVTVLAVPDLTQRARLRSASTFDFVTTYNVLAFLYLAMTLMLSASVRFLEQKLKIEE